MLIPIPIMIMMMMVMMMMLVMTMILCFMANNLIENSHADNLIRIEYCKLYLLQIQLLIASYGPSDRPTARYID